MASVNNDPIYSRAGDVTFDGVKAMGSAITAAANDYTGVGVANIRVATADPTNGGYIQRLRFKAIGTNSSATVARIFINNGLPAGQSILAPVAPTAAASSSGGFIPTSTTYFAQVAARDAYGGWAPAGAASTAVSTTGPSASIVWSTTAVVGASEYRIFLSSTANTALYDFYILSNCPNVWGYTQGSPAATGGSIAAGTNFCMVNIQTTGGTFLMPCYATGITTTGSTSSIVWTAPTITGQGAIISYDYWFSTTAIAPGSTSIYHTGVLSPVSNTYTQTLPASSYTAGTAPIIAGASVWTQTYPPQFYNDGIPSSCTNNTFYGELSLPATTLSATAATVDIDYPLNFALPPGYSIYVGLGTAATVGWTVTPIMGKY